MQFLDKVFYMSVVVLRVVPRSRQCSTLFGGSAVTVHHGHLITDVAQRPSPWLRLFSRPLRFHCCRFDVSVVQDRQVRRVQSWRRQPCPTLLSFAGADMKNTFEIPQLQVPQVQSWKRQLKSHSFGLLVLGLGVQVSRFHRCSLRGDSRYPTVAASRRICSTLTRWSMSRLWFACLLLLNNRCRHSRWVFLGPCTQVHGRVLPPLGWGRGGGDAGSSLPGVLPPNKVHLRRDPGQTRRVLHHLNHTHHTHHKGSNRCCLSLVSPICEP